MMRYLLFLILTALINAVSLSCPVEYCHCDRDLIRCNGSPIVDLVQLFKSNITTIELINCKTDRLDFNRFENATNLRRLKLVNCGIEQLVEGRVEFPQLYWIDLTDNYVFNFGHTLTIIESMAPNVYSLDLSGNLLNSVKKPTNPIDRLERLNLSRNSIANLHGFPSNVKRLDLSWNRIAHLNRVIWPVRLTHLILVHNLIKIVKTPTLDLPNLLQLNLSYNQISLISNDSLAPLMSIRSIDCSHNPLTGFEQNVSMLVHLTNLRITHTKMRYFNADLASQTRTALDLDLSNNDMLSSIVGQIGPNIRSFNIEHCRLRFLPRQFLEKAVYLRELRLDGNQWTCSRCLSEWKRYLPKDNLFECESTEDNNSNDDECSLGINNQRTVPAIIRGVYGSDAVLPCDHYGSPEPTVVWYRFHPRQRLGSYIAEPGRRRVEQENMPDYQILLGGELLLHSVGRRQVERYQCSISNGRDGNTSKTVTSALVRFRLDFSSWYRLSFFNSVFLGSLMCSVLTTAATFVLNLFWLLCRKLILWRINRAERTSRLHRMLEAVEKYRQRQMVVVYEKYTRQMNIARENYHLQTEQLRSSYAAQIGRFREYRTAQMETMTQHLDSLLDNYDQQMSRIREFGSRRADQLWESYQRQVNFIRTFSLQQRLRLMRQYKVKQRYLNKLLEGLNVEQQNRSSAVAEPMRVGLDLRERFPLSDSVSSLSSYYSLPESDHEELAMVSECTSHATEINK